MSDSGRVVLFGSHGQLGARLFAKLNHAGYDVTAIDRARCDFATSSERDIEIILRAVEPALLINAAAFTAVDAAESARADASRVNAAVPEIMARAAQASAIPFLHFSTDYVFDGARGAPYGVDAPPAPVNHYGATKLAGERAVMAYGAHCFRLQLVYEAARENFFSRIRAALQTRDEIRVVADQIAAPSFVGHVATAMTTAVPKIVEKSLPSGIYHLAAAGHTSRHGFACAIAQAMGSATRIIPITSAEFPTPAARPHDTRLDCRTLAAYGISMPHWRDGVAAAMEE